MKLRKVGLVVAAGLAVFALSACGKSAKDTVVSSSQTLLNAKQLESSSSISMNLSTNAKDVTSDEKFVMTYVNALSLTADTKADNDAKKTETTIGANFNVDGMSMKMSLPIFVDENKNSIYIKAQNIKSLLSLAGGSIDTTPFEKFEGKVIELTGDQLQMNASDSKAFDDKVNQTLSSTLTSLPENQFQKNGNAYSVTLTAKDVQKLILDLANGLKTIKSANITDDQIKQLQDGLKQSNFANSNSSIVLSYTLDGSNIKNEKIVANLVVPNPDNNKETVTFKFTVSSDIKSINQKVNFDFDTSAKNVVSLNDLEQAFMQAESSPSGVLDSGMNKGMSSSSAF